MDSCGDQRFYEVWISVAHVLLDGNPVILAVKSHPPSRSPPQGTVTRNVTRGGELFFLAGGRVSDRGRETLLPRAETCFDTFRFEETSSFWFAMHLKVAFLSECAECRCIVCSEGLPSLHTDANEL